MLEKIKILLDLNNDKQDSKLNLYIDIAIDSIKSYLNNPKFDNDYIKENFQSAIIELVCKAYMSKNTKNIKQMSQGSRSVTYSDTNTGFKITDDIAELLPSPYLKLR